jgi:hypothetical protein
MKIRACRYNCRVSRRCYADAGGLSLPEVHLVAYQHVPPRDLNIGRAVGMLCRSADLDVTRRLFGDVQTMTRHSLIQPLFVLGLRATCVGLVAR